LNGRKKENKFLILGDLIAKLVEIQEIYIYTIEHIKDYLKKKLLITW